MTVGFNKVRGIIEALVFASSEPVRLREIAEILGIHEYTVRDLLDDLMSEYSQNQRGIQITQVAGGYQFATNPAYADFIKKMKKTPRHTPLSQAALETLAIIAYKQPVTRAEIEALRGVSVDSSLNTLLERGLIEEKGRKDGPGRPILYATTGNFLKYFGLTDLSELPAIEDWTVAGVAVESIMNIDH
jgi:segregation and condensation protein B